MICAVCWIYGSAEKSTVTDWLALEESIIPYKVDVVDWHGISASFQENISNDLVQIDLDNKDMG